MSAVIPSHNRQSCLDRVLGTYLQQPSIAEVIIVDDASWPPLVVPERFRSSEKPVRIVRLGEKTCSPLARNQGTRAAAHPWVLFSDDDVFLGDDYVTGLLACQQRWMAGVVAGRRLYLNDDETQAGAISRHDARRGKVFNTRLLLADFSMPIMEDLPCLHLQTTMLVSRELALEVGWDESLTIPSFREETDFCLRIARSGAPVVMCHDALCFHLSPTDCSQGGQRALPWWRYELGVISNNHHFLNQHYSFLQSRGAIQGSRSVAELRFITWRLWGRLKTGALPFSCNPVKHCIRQLPGPTARGVGRQFSSI